MEKKALDIRNFSEKYRTLETAEERTALVEETKSKIALIDSKEEAMDFLKQLSEALNKLQVEVRNEKGFDETNRLAS